MIYYRRATPVAARHERSGCPKDETPTATMAPVGTAPIPGRVPFAHDAVVTMDRSADDRAPGAAITAALCGDHSHEPPCPLAAHFTTAVRSKQEVRLRILFATRPADEDRVRQIIHQVLADGTAPNQHGQPMTWQLQSDGASAVRPEEANHAERLTRS